MGFSELPAGTPDATHIVQGGIWIITKENIVNAHNIYTYLIET
jgi:hypothetical protein